MRKAVLQTLLCLTLLVLAACGSPPTLTHHPAPLSVYLADTSLHALNASDGSVRWSQKDCDLPILENGVVYANYAKVLDHGVVAFDASDGRQLWFYRASGPLFIAAVVNGVVYTVVQSANSLYGTMYALRDGKVLWHAEQPQLSVDSGYSADGIVYAGMPVKPHEGIFGVAAIDATTGALLWNYQPDDGDPYLLQASNGQAFMLVSSRQRPTQVYFSALNTSDGSVRWRYPQTGYASFRGLAVGDGLVYLNSLDDGMLYALNTSDGSLKWRSGNGGGNDNTHAFLTSDTFYVGLGDGSFYALNASDGALKWQAHIGGGGPWATVPQAAADGSLYISRFQSGLVVLNASDGSVRWTQGDLQDVVWTIAPIEGVAYVYTSDTVANRSTFYAFDMSTGAQRWKYQTTWALMPAIG